MFERAVGPLKYGYIRRKLWVTLGVIVAVELLTRVVMLGLAGTTSEAGLLPAWLGSVLLVFQQYGLDSVFSVLAGGILPYLITLFVCGLLLRLPSVSVLLEGTTGRARLAAIFDYTNLLVIALWSGLLVLLYRQANAAGLLADGILPLLAAATAVMAGAMLVRWLADLVSARGVGIGASVILFGGAVAVLVGAFERVMESEGRWGLVVLAAVIVGVAVIAAYLTTCKKQYWVGYGVRTRRARAASGMHPLRVDSDTFFIDGLPFGVAPTFIVLAVLLLLAMLNSALGAVGGPFWTISKVLHAAMAPGRPWFWLVFFALATFFQLLFADVSWRQQTPAIAERLGSTDAWVPGVRPNGTERYLDAIGHRLFVTTSLLTGVTVAVLPPLVHWLTGVAVLDAVLAMFLITDVVIDTLYRTEALGLMLRYEGYMRRNVGAPAANASSLQPNTEEQAVKAGDERGHRG